MKDISIKKKKKKTTEYIRKQIESPRLYMPRKNIQRKSTQRKSITPSINYAIEVIVFEQEKQPWETMNQELHKVLVETIFD